MLRGRRGGAEGAQKGHRRGVEGTQRGREWGGQTTCSTWQAAGEA